MNRYHLFIPGLTQTLTVYGDSYRDAITQFKAVRGLLRMPVGYSIFRA